jgi:hypothetical protein
MIAKRASTSNAGPSAVAEGVVAGSATTDHPPCLPRPRPRRPAVGPELGPARRSSSPHKPNRPIRPHAP